MLVRFKIIARIRIMNAMYKPYFFIFQSPWPAIPLIIPKIKTIIPITVDVPASNPKKPVAPRVVMVKPSTIKPIPPMIPKMATRKNRIESILIPKGLSGIIFCCFL